MEILSAMHSLAAFMTVFIFIFFGFTRFRSVGKPIVIQQIPLVVLFVFSFGFLLYCRLTSDGEAKFTSVGAISIFVVSLSLFFSALFCARGVDLGKAFETISANQIVSKGPFSVIRHPFYTSYLIGYSAVFFDQVSVASVVLGLLLWVCYLLAARNEEAAFLNDSNLKKAYERYTQGTGRFLPRIKRGTP